MYWIVLLSSAVMEAVWATALGLSRGFTEPLPTAVFIAGMVLSMAGLGYAMRGVPVGTAYAVWTGVGAVLTVAAGVLFAGEQAGPLKILFLAGIIACVAGLKLVDRKSGSSGGQEAGPAPAGTGRAAG
jgi:quaternary ammonium compound-resistance protein SugE